jgi:hypothetical protein
MGLAAGIWRCPTGTISIIGSMAGFTLFMPARVPRIATITGPLLAA